MDLCFNPMEAPHSLILRTLSTEMLSLILYRLGKPSLALAARTCKQLMDSARYMYELQERAKKRFAFSFTPIVVERNDGFYSEIELGDEIFLDKGIIDSENGRKNYFINDNHLQEVTLDLVTSVDTAIVPAPKIRTTFLVQPEEKSYAISWDTGSVRLFSDYLNPNYNDSTVAVSSNGLLLSFRGDMVVEYDERHNTWDLKCVIPKKYWFDERGFYRVAQSDAGIFVFRFVKDPTSPLMITLDKIIRYNDRDNTFAFIHTTGDFPTFFSDIGGITVEIHAVGQNFAFFPCQCQEYHVYMLVLTDIHGICHGRLEKLPLPSSIFAYPFPYWNTDFAFHVKQDSFVYYVRNVGAFELCSTESGLATVV